MNIKQYIEEYSIKKSKALRCYFLGNEYKLFLKEEDDHIKNLMKSNKKEFRSMIYRFNYFIALIILLIVIGTGAFPLIIFLFPFFIKPLVHFFALDNKIKNKNIYLYKKYYGK